MMPSAPSMPPADAHLMQAYARQSVSFVRGCGARLWDDRGVEYLDAIAGVAVANLGHAHPEVAAAIAEQAGLLLHTSNLFGIAWQERLGQRLCELSGMQRAFFCNSGAEANETALKLARLHGNRRKVTQPQVLVMENSFHGRTIATLAATDNPAVQRGFEPLLPGFLRIPYDDIEAARRAAGSTPDIVAVLLESVQGEGGVRTPSAGYLEALRALCDRHDWLLIIDEVQAGMGRTGTWFGYQHAGVLPDVITLAKGLGNGFPVGACLARGSAAELFSPGHHGSTFGGNPLACRVGCTVLDIMARDRIPERAATLGRRLLAGLREALGGHPGIVSIRGLGLMVGIELDRCCTELVGRALEEQRLLISVTRERTIRLLPPLVCEEAQIEDIVARLALLLNAGARPADRVQQEPAGRRPVPTAIHPSTHGGNMYESSVTLAEFDAELAAAVQHEECRQEDHAELIASENYASPLVMAVQDSVFTNKYAEGYPGKRYYSGCEYVDAAERLAIERAKALFGCDYANVQPHAGAQANAAVFLALVNPGDTVMGMNLAQGGHLTHGNPANFSGRHYRIVPYGLDPETGLIDYDEMERIALQTRPKLLIGGFSAYSRQMDWARMRAIADRVGALFWVDMAHVAGLVAAGEYPDPLPHAHVVTSTTHKTLRGPRGGIILSNAQGDAFYRRLDAAVFPGIQGGPLMHLIAAKAIAFKEALSPGFKTYQQQVVANARAMAAMLQQRGYRIVSGGTDNHMMLIDLTARPYTGKDADRALSAAHITANKNSVPNDPRSPFVTSGLRIGTPAVTTRGFAVAECERLAGWLCDVLDSLESGAGEEVTRRVRDQVTALCRRYPVYAAK